MFNAVIDGKRKHFEVIKCALKECEHTQEEHQTFSNYLKIIESLFDITTALAKKFDLDGVYCPASDHVIMALLTIINSLIYLRHHSDNLLRDIAARLLEIASHQDMIRAKKMENETRKNREN